MTPRVLFGLQVMAYAAFPLYFARLRSGMRVALLYMYVGVVLVVGGFLGAVHRYPLTDDVSISAGSVAYGALMMSTLVLVLVGNEVQVVRNVVRIVVVVNVFKVVLYQVTATALRSEAYPNPFDTSAEVFSVSLRVVAAGGFLIVVELLVLLFAFERLQRIIERHALLTASYVACFVAVLCLDGVLFPILAISGVDDLGDVIRRGVEAKLFLAVAFAVPLVAFLVFCRSSIASYAATPFRMHELFFAPRDEILTELVREREARRASDRQLQARDALSQAMALVDRDAPLEEVLDCVGRVLADLPGVRPVPVGLVVVEGDDVVELGPRSGAATDRARALAASAGDEPWVEARDLDDVVCIPIRSGDELDAILEVSVTHDDAPSLVATLGALDVQASAVLRPAVQRTRRLSSERAPIEAILQSGRVDVVFQPIVSLVDGEVVGFEGLSRFEPGVSPETRFKHAARLGLGTELELVAVRSVLTAAAGLPAGVPVAVNVSPATLLVAGLVEALAAADRPVKLEVTEHDAVDDYDTLMAALARLGDVRLAVDDAGSGYASLQHILKLRPHEVKLDRAWVDGIDLDRPRQVLVGGMCSFVGEIGASLVAEGIEREEEAAALRALGVGIGQGYLFGRPAPAATFATR